MDPLVERQCYHALLKKLGGDISKLNQAIKTYGSFTAAWASHGKKPEEPEADWQKLGEWGIRLIMKDDENFPPLLREAPDAPLGLYIKGNEAAITNTSVGIVGTRKATVGGLKTARDFGRTLAKAGLTVVSGLAFGIDAAAHSGALEGEGPTVAVLPGGLDKVYPSEHFALAEKILEKNGALVSEYPPGSVSYPARFLERNRVISGLSRATIVIEAPERSGALATARLAADQNREVGAVPGPITHPNFRGTNLLIKNGAALITDVADIFELISFIPGSLPFPANSSGNVLDKEETAVFEAIKMLSPGVTVDKIIKACKLEPQVVQRHLTFLIVKDMIREVGGRYEPN
jgi:DNA processing protein